MKAKLALLLSFLIFVSRNFCRYCTREYIHCSATGLSKKPLYRYDTPALDSSGRISVKRRIQLYTYTGRPDVFPKQLEKTYPKSEGQVPVAKLEGLARTLFVAAPPFER